MFTDGDAARRNSAMCQRSAELFFVSRLCPCLQLPELGNVAQPPPIHGLVCGELLPAPPPSKWSSFLCEVQVCRLFPVFLLL